MVNERLEAREHRVGGEARGCVRAHGSLMWRVQAGFLQGVAPELSFCALKAVPARELELGVEGSAGPPACQEGETLLERE